MILALDEESQLLVKKKDGKVKQPPTAAFIHFEARREDVLFEISLLFFRRLEPIAKTVGRMAARVDALRH